MSVSPESPSPSSALHNPRFPAAILTPGADTRNVIDPLRALSDEEIRAELAQQAFPLVVVLENFAHDFNIGTAVRNANAFGASRVVILGRRGWDRRGSVGVQNYTPIERTRDLDELYTGLRASGHQIVAVENIPGALSLESHSWRRATALVLGQEDIGVSNASLAHADVCVSIPMFGSVRSLNVGTASGIVMHSYATWAAAHPE